MSTRNNHGRTDRRNVERNIPTAQAEGEREESNVATAPTTETPVETTAPVVESSPAAEPATATQAAPEAQAPASAVNANPNDPRTMAGFSSIAPSPSARWLSLTYKDGNKPHPDERFDGARGGRYVWREADGVVHFAGIVRNVEGAIVPKSCKRFVLNGALIGNGACPLTETKTNWFDAQKIVDMTIYPESSKLVIRRKAGKLLADVKTDVFAVTILGTL